MSRAPAKHKLVQDFTKSFPEGVAHLHLDAGIDAGITIAQRGRGDMHGIHPDINGSLFAGEVMKAYAALWRKVPYAG